MGLNGSAAYSMLKRTVEGLASGVKSHSVDGLTLHLIFNDGSASDIVFEQPKDGTDGQGAYEAAVEEGFEGTKEEWLESLQGKPGENGKDGKDGKDGVVVTCKFPYWETGNESDGNTAYISTGEGYLFTQTTPSTIWTITHNFGYRYPSIICIDDDENQIFGQVHFQSENVAIVTFPEAIKGKAFIK